MGGKQTKEPEAPPPTVKEIVKGFTRQIKRMRNEFQRTINQLKMQNTKITNEIKRMVEKKEQRANIRIIAKGLIRNNNHLTKYARLDAQLADVEFQLNNIATTDAMVNVMKEMTKILKVNESNLDMKNVQKTMQQFMMQMEKQELMSEQINDIMEDGDLDESDEATDKIIQELEVAKQGGGNGGAQLNNEKDKGLSDLEAELNKLK